MKSMRLQSQAKGSGNDWKEESPLTRGEVRNRLLGVTDLTNLERTGGPLGSFSCNGYTRAV